MQKIKIIIFYFAKYMGLFYVSRKITAKGLRIICYHGFSFSDESSFRPKLFMRKETLDKRLEIISRKGYSVIGLDDAVQSMKAGHVPKDSIVITVDDGWQGVEDIAWPLFEKYDFPWTLYLSTYYVDKQTQVMNLAIQYLCWKTTKSEVDISAFDVGLKSKLYKRQDMDFNNLANELTQICNAQKTAEDRQTFVRKVAIVLGVDQDEIERNKLFYFVDKNTIKKMDDAGVDIQLHTHRHTLGGEDEEKIASEINDNRKVVTEICSHNPVHFCYPSGFYTEKHLGWLNDNDIVSATTCHAGLNYINAPLLELNRFLDDEKVFLIEF